MTNLITSLLNRNRKRKLEKIFNEYLEGQISFDMLKDALKGDVLIQFEFAPNERAIHKIDIDLDFKIQVEERHIQFVLEKYHQGVISGKELSDWAALIYMMPVFVPKGDTEKERWEYGEGPVWDILQRLAAPDLSNGITPDVVRRYLEMLVRK